MNFVVGGRGRLGRALTSSSDGGTIALDRSVYAKWTEAGAADDVARFFEPFAGTSFYIAVAAGIIDPTRSSEEHQQVNVTLPRNIVEGAARHGARILTFGTIMEEIVGRPTRNHYFDSKLQLSDFIQDAASRHRDVLHVRIHTLYGGGPPDRFMFLGQLLDALRRQSVFSMSAGTQLREYHHVEDDVEAITLLAKSGLTGAINLNHGAPIRLRELASYICGRFGCMDRLEIGAIASSESENHDRKFDRPAPLRDVIFRDTMPAVFDYIKFHISSI